MSNQFIENCALCHHDNLQDYGTLFESPLANNLYSTVYESLNSQKYPLGLKRCLNCNHIQLSFEVDPREMFSNYTYKSGISATFRSHFKNLASQLIHRYLQNSSISPCVLDIGCNDGVLLDYFSELKCTTYGFEPASNLLPDISSIHTIYNNFFDKKSASDHNLMSKFDLITANNVFAHTRDLSSFAKGVAYSLKDTGVFVFEVQYFKDMVENCLFDMIYHEHTSYHHIAPLVQILPSYGLHVFDVEMVSTHGGSIRVHCSKIKKDITKQMSNSIALERDFFEQDFHHDTVINAFYSKVRETVHSLDSTILDFVDKGYLIWGYTAPAKSTSWVAALSLPAKSAIQFIIEDAALKQGKFLPGSDIPIIAANKLGELKPTTSFRPLSQFDTKSIGIIFSWNIIDSLSVNLVSRRIGSGSYLVPLPKFQIVTLF